MSVACCLSASGYNGTKYINVLMTVLFLPLYYVDVGVIGFLRLLRLFPVKLRVLLPSPLLPLTTSHLLRTTPGKCHLSETKSKICQSHSSPFSFSKKLSSQHNTQNALNMHANKALSKVVLQSLQTVRH